jgi:hypothetical protein
MKLFVAHPGFAAAAAVLLTGFFQFPTTPPMKMGLWESDGAMKMKGMPLGLGNKTMRVSTCVTPESYAKAITSSQDQKNCVRTNEVWNGKGYSGDLSCNNGQATGHVEYTFDGPEAGHGTSHVDMGRISVDHSWTMKFVSSDCGNVSPDKPVVLK